MSHLALYRKYRSQDFNELVGQAHVTATLANAVASGRISHAYLFAGPRGTGKTSAARIFARLVNNLKLEEAISHLDIIEIDAASNRRIDEIRDLREKVHVAPAMAKYKVYIIDEAHMLTTEAFNALLKTLEEPPAHVIFILATTEPHKLPETIVSRTQRFSFRPIEAAQLQAHLKKIAKAEKISINDEAIEAIALAGEGSARDSLSLLDQVANLVGDKEITAKVIGESLGLASQDQLKQLIKEVISGKPKEVLATIDQWIGQGYNAHQIHQQLVQTCQRLIRDNLESKLAQTLLRLQRQLSMVSTNSQQPWTALEAALLTATMVKIDSEPSRTPPTVAAKAQSAPEPKKQQPETTKPKASSSTVKTEPTTAPPKSKFSEDLWLKALTQVKQKNNSMYALLRMAEPDYDAKEAVLSLGFRFQFHQRKLQEGKYRRFLEEVLQDVFGHHISVQAIVDTEAKVSTSDKAEAIEDKAVVEDVLQILGGEVVNDKNK